MVNDILMLWIDWLNWGFLSHSTLNRSFWRCYSEPIYRIVLRKLNTKNKHKEQKIHGLTEATKNKPKLHRKLYELLICVCISLYTTVVHISDTMNCTKPSILLNGKLSIPFLSTMFVWHVLTTFARQSWWLVVRRLSTAGLCARRYVSGTRCAAGWRAGVQVRLWVRVDDQIGIRRQRDTWLVNAARARWWSCYVSSRLIAVLFTFCP